jgi:hypothetical protein
MRKQRISRKRLDMNVKPSIGVPSTLFNFQFGSTSRNSEKPEVVRFLKTVSDRNVVPSAFCSEKYPLPVEIEKFVKTGTTLFLDNG